MSRIYFINPKECHGLRGIDQLDGSHVRKLIKMGREGLLKHLNENPVKYQRMRGSILISDGCHRTYAASKLELPQIPAFYVAALAQERPLEKIENLELLTKRAFNAYVDGSAESH